MLSNSTRYAIRASVYLALHAGKGNMVGIKDIARELQIPSPFLAKILQNLAKHNILLSTKGPNGGFCLAKPASKINFYDIVTIIEGPAFFDQCLVSMRSCKEEGKACIFHEKYDPVRTALREMFNEQTLEDMVGYIQTNNKVMIL